MGKQQDMKETEPTFENSRYVFLSIQNYPSLSFFSRLTSVLHQQKHRCVEKRSTNECYKGQKTKYVKKINASKINLEFLGQMMYGSFLDLTEGNNFESCSWLRGTMKYKFIQAPKISISYENLAKTQ